MFAAGTTIFVCPVVGNAGGVAAVTKKVCGIPFCACTLYADRNNKDAENRIVKNLFMFPLVKYGNNVIIIPLENPRFWAE